MHDGIETGLFNLTGVTLDQLDRLDPYSDPELAEAMEAAVAQVERPRTNLGSSGPPGRAD